MRKTCECSRCLEHRHCVECRRVIEDTETRYHVQQEQQSSLFAVARVWIGPLCEGCRMKRGKAA
jgi:hypothetical protein